MDYNRNIGRLVGHLNHKFLRTLDELFYIEQIPLTAEQFRLMTVLWDTDNLSQQSIAERIGRNRASTGKMLDVLEKKNIVKRQDNPQDRRVKLIVVTSKGKKLNNKAKNIANAVLEKACTDIPKRQVNEILHYLELMLKNLE